MINEVLLQRRSLARHAHSRGRKCVTEVSACNVVTSALSTTTTSGARRARVLRCTRGTAIDAYQVNTISSDILMGKVPGADPGPE